MKKTSVIAVPLVTILLLVDLASANPIDNSANPDFHDVTMKPVAGSSEREIDFTGPSFAEFDASDFVATNSPDDKKIVEDLNSDESHRILTPLRPVPEEIHEVIPNLKPGFERPSREPEITKPDPEKPGSFVANLKPDFWPAGSPSHIMPTLRPVSEEIREVIPNLKPGFERPSRVPEISKTDPEKPGNFIASLKPDSWAAGSSLTTVATISGGNAGSLVTSLEPGSGGPDSLATTMEPDILSTVRDIGSREPGSLSTTLESGSRRRGSLTPTLTPGFHDPGNKLTNEPVTKESKNAASDIRSSCTIVLLVIFLIAGSQLTHKIS